MAISKVPSSGITADFDNSLTTADLAPNSVDSSELVDGAVDLSHMSANSVDSDQYVDASIDTAHIGNDQVTLAKMAGGTDGQIITYDASGDPVAVGPGTDGQVLTSTGAGSPPAFETAAAGGTLVKTATATLSADSASYNNTIIDFDNTSALFTASFTPDGGSGNNTTIYAWLHLVVTTEYSSGEGRKQWRYKIEGDDITNFDSGISYVTHTYSGAAGSMNSIISLQNRVLDGSGNAAITYSVWFSNANPTASGTSFIMKGSGNMIETHIVFMEVQE